METTIEFRSCSAEYAAYFDGLSDGRLYLNRRIPKGQDSEYDRGFDNGQRGR